MSRFLKQVIYGGSFLAILLALISYGLYVSFQTPPTCFDNIQNQEEENVDCGGPCSLSCVLKFLKPLKVSNVTIAHHPDKTVSILAEIRNFNTDHGLPQFTYDLVFYDAAGAGIMTVTKESFIYPGEIKYLVDQAIQVPEGVARATITVKDVTPLSWKTKDEFFQPDVQTRNIQFEEQAEKRELYVSGLVVNNTNTPLTRVTVNVIAANLFGLESGFSQTLLENLRPFEERFFRVVIPDINFSNFKQGATKIYLSIEQ
jgi:hypothetical protein